MVSSNSKEWNSENKKIVLTFQKRRRIWLWRCSGPWSPFSLSSPSSPPPPLGDWRERYIQQWENNVRALHLSTSSLSLPLLFPLRSPIYSFTFSFSPSFLSFSPSIPFLLLILFPSPLISPPSLSYMVEEARHVSSCLICPSSASPLLS